MTTQERDAHGRYSHTWGGIVAQDSRGDIEQCTGCGVLRDGRRRRVRPETIRPEAYFGHERVAWEAANPGHIVYELTPLRAPRAS